MQFQSAPGTESETSISGREAFETHSLLLSDPFQTLPGSNLQTARGYPRVVGGHGGRSQEGMSMTVQ